MNARKIKFDSEEVMDQGIGQRILLIQKDKMLTNEQLAEICGTSGTTVGKYLSGETLPKQRFLELFANNFKVSLDWLVLGVGPKYRSVESCVQASETPADYQAQVIELKHELADKDRELAAVERAMGKQQSLIFEAVRRTCRELELSPDQTRSLQWAVMDYENAQDSARSDQQDAAASHQQAVGD